MGFRFSMNDDRTLRDGVSIVIHLGPLSVRNLSNIAHNRDCIAQIEQRADSGRLEAQPACLR